MSKNHYKATEKQYSLKDILFNEAKVKKLAEEITAVYPAFQSQKFVKELVTAFPQLELMERIMLIRDTLQKHLPADYKESLQIILKALPPELDTTNTDDDFGDFIYAPYGAFVATYGCTPDHVSRSLNALKEITKRFSMEAAIRDFLIKFPGETNAVLLSWAVDKNYHVRRLASEGTRPNLPWAKKIEAVPGDYLHLLDTLHADETRYVTRSVANHLNDIAKTKPDLVVKTLKRWQKEKRQNQKELEYITRHALRTLIKRGHGGALGLLGFGVPEVLVQKFSVTPKSVMVGQTLNLELTIKSKKHQALLVDYLIHFKKANGAHFAKVFKWTKVEAKAGEEIVLSKKHPLRAMSTRALYPGVHKVEVQINGQVVKSGEFILK
jgi:3-methyladenine DNA glycosylase AlkC